MYFRIKDNTYFLAHSYICRFLSWKRRNYFQGHVLESLCTGAFEGMIFGMLFTLSWFSLVVFSHFLSWSSGNNPSHGSLNHVDAETKENAVQTTGLC